MKYFDELRVQRWDDHRYYHQSRINQTLHLLSAISFLCAYVLLFVNPIAASIVGWVVAMSLRQSGHFFFERKGYDNVNQVTHEHKEDIKVGYNLRRKIVLIAIWAATPAILYLKPDFFGIFVAHADTYGFVYNLSILWLALGVLALLFRTVHLFFIKDIQSGLVWFTKILTDPFHDIKLYYKSPYYLFKGELFDPIGSHS